MNPAAFVAAAPLVAGAPRAAQTASGKCSTVGPARAQRQVSLKSEVFGTTVASPFRATDAQRTFLGSPDVRVRGPVCQAPEGAVAERAADAAEGLDKLVSKEGMRNIAIIAHVDHGKTTLVDAMLKQSRVFRDNQVMQERVMDSNALERERGITILAKNTAIRYDGLKINILDTPGHADFGGEVERILNMVDGVLLLVDAVEGPMPQTRFVLRKALELDLKVVLVINKVDRPMSRPEHVVNTTFDLFVDLGATDEQADFETVYCIGLAGKAGMAPDALADDLAPLFEAIKGLPAPKVVVDGPLQMMVTSLDYDEHKGRIAIGRVRSGTIAKGREIVYGVPGTEGKKGKINELFVFENLGRTTADSADAGEIVAICGIDDISIGETLCDRDAPNFLKPIEVEEPTVRMEFSVNTSPFAGREGKFVTSRMVRDRLFKELERNVSLRVEETESSDTFLVSGRGSLHLAILIETMRREGYEFMVGAPRVINREIDGEMNEPFEDVYVEVPEEHVGAVVDLLGRRRGQMANMHAGATGNITFLHYIMPTRGLLGLRNTLLTATRGTAVLNSLFNSYQPLAGDLERRQQGSLISMETGATTPYALERCQERGQLFVVPGIDVYLGMLIGVHQRPGDLPLNACRKKAVNNIRSSNKEEGIQLAEPLKMSLDDAIEYINDDELVEVTPLSIRLTKKDREGSLKQKASKGK
eukprot:tig00000194_g14785.t1